MSWRIPRSIFCMQGSRDRSSHLAIGDHIGLSSLGSFMISFLEMEQMRKRWNRCKIHLLRQTQQRMQKKRKEIPEPWRSWRLQ